MSDRDRIPVTKMLSCWAVYQIIDEKIIKPSLPIKSITLLLVIDSVYWKPLRSL